MSNCKRVKIESPTVIVIELPLELWHFIYDFLHDDDDILSLAALKRTSRALFGTRRSPGQLLDKEGRLEPWMARLQWRINSALVNNSSYFAAVSRIPVERGFPWVLLKIESKKIFIICKISGMILRDSHANDGPLCCITDDAPELPLIGEIDTSRPVQEEGDSTSVQKKEREAKLALARDLWQTIWGNPDCQDEEALRKVKSIDHRRDVIWPTAWQHVHTPRILVKSNIK